MTSSGRHPCHVCGVTALVLSPGFETLGRATSDCRPWPSGGTIGICESCGTVQRRLDAAWRADVQKIYGQYHAYRQSRDGQEQAVFDAESGLPMTRSRWILERFLAERKLSERGRMIDVGCGNGAMLTAFSSVLPGWQLNGYEPYGSDPARLRAIPGFATLWDGKMSDIAGSFDLITLSHSLEHIEAPIPYLAQLRDQLTPNGRLLIEVPYFPDNPFDLIVADHCSHFTLETLAGVLHAAGCDIELARTDIVTKEITLLARRAAGEHRAEMTACTDLARAKAVLAAAVSWLQDVKRDALAASGEGPFGLFGTSIGGNWLLGEVGACIAFFVDEDPARVGTTYENRPVFAPRDTPPGSTVFMILPYMIARQIVGRLSAVKADFRLPPAYVNISPESAIGG